MTLVTYTPRGVPAFDQGWFFQEHTLIKQGLQQVQDKVDAISGPAAVTTVQRSSAVTNASAVLASAGLGVSVASGSSYFIDYTLLMSNNFLGSIPAVLSIAIPAMSVFFAQINAPTSGSSAYALTTIVSTSSPVSFGTWLNFAADQLVVRIHAVLRNCTANGTVDLQFANDGGSNTITIGDGSCAVATTL